MGRERRRKHRSKERRITGAMDEKELTKQLAREGFARTNVWQNGARAHYPDHTHDAETARIILDGEMTMTIGGRSKTFRVGDRCDVPAGLVHSARMGPAGCRYLIGEKGETAERDEN
jgi:mannose-6-phosphate isomerase-like protein (cupin superfamily)